MVSKFELSLAKDYVPDWTLVDAVREFFQNALDQETTVEGNAMFWQYDEDRKVLSIGNKKSVLDVQTLLLGTTTKAEDNQTIGQFGEGYKIATLVATRLGKKVVFYNYGAREVWKPRFVKSRRYNGAEVLTFFVDKKYPWTNVPDNNLTIEIHDVTDDEYYEVANANLHMQDAYGYWVSKKGKILTDEDMKGNMYVNGLYICHNEHFHYGYDFKPEYITLDRDRRLIRDFELSWTTSQMWVGIDDSEIGWDSDIVDAASQLVAIDAPDVKYIETNSYQGKTVFEAIAETAYGNFKMAHGENAVPVTSNDEYMATPETHKPIIVKDTLKEVITSSPYYVAPRLITKPSCSQRLREWIDVWRHTLDDVPLNELLSILEDEED